MTQFSFEVPIAHLEDFHDLQDFYFALSIFCKDKSYKNYFLNQATKGIKQVWLDNSFNETGKADQPAKLAKIADKIGAHKIISPDDPAWSIARISRAFYKMSSFISTNNIIVVVNSLLMKDCLFAHGARNFALSYHIRLPFYQSTTYASLEFKWAKDCHFLGLCSVAELRNLHPLSCDTSIPIKLALQGISLRRWHEDGYRRSYHKPGENKFSYFNVRMTREQINLAKENIMNLKYIVNH